MLLKESKYWIKPSWWEILFYIVWSSIFFNFAGNKFLELSLVYFVIFLLGFSLLFNGVQQLRRHKLKNLKGKEHRLCIKSAWMSIFLSGVVLIVILIDSIRFG